MRTCLALLPEAWLHGRVFVLASTFVAINTLIYLALALVKLMPVVVPARWLPHHYHRAESLAALGQHAAAFKSFSTALAKAEKDPRQQAVVPTLRVRRVETAMAAGLYGEALDGFRALLQMSPDDPRLLLGLGMAHVGQGEGKAALEVFDRLIAKSPSAAAHYGRALAYQQSGQHAAALSDLDEAVRLEPRNPQYAQMRAAVASSGKAGQAAQPPAR